MKMQPKLLGMATLIILVAMSLTTASIAAQEQATMPYNEVSNVVIDGTIGANEYAGSYSEAITGMDIYWEHNETVMYIGLESPGEGWVGIAFGPIGVGMTDASVIIGYVDDSSGNLILGDHFGTSQISHAADTSLEGGSDNIVSKAGSQIGGKTIIEFVFPLNSGDQPYDHSFSPGDTYGFNVAYQQTADDLETYHTAHSLSIDLYLEAPETPGAPPKADFSYVLDGFTVEFTDKSSAQVGSIDSWFWDFGDGTNSTEKNPSHTYSEMDTYRVSLNVTDDEGGTDKTPTESLMVPSAEDRMQLWITQVAIITIAIGFVSFTAVLTARKIGAKKKEGKLHGLT